MQSKFFKSNICMILLFSMLVFLPKRTTIATSTTGETEKYTVTLETNGGTLINYDKNQDIYFQPGKPLKLPKAKKKGYVFCGWTTMPSSNIAWFTISGVNTDNPFSSTYHNPYGSTYLWHEPKKLYAQYAKVTMKKLGKRKLKVSLSKWVDADMLIIEHSTNKNFNGTKHIAVVYRQGRLLAPIDKKNCSLKYNKKKKTLSLTFSKLKAKKKHYFRFHYSDTLEEQRLENGQLQWEVLSIGDWFQKSMKM